MSLTNDTTMLVTPVNGTMGGGGGWGNGNNDWWILILFLLFGWGRGGWGGQQGGVGAQSACATTADVYGAVDQQTLISKLDQQTYGLADSTFALNNTINQGFANAELSRCQQQANLMQQLYGMQSSNEKCCCETQRAIDGVNFNITKGLCDIGNLINMQTRDIVDNQNANYRGLMDFLVQEKLSSKDAQIAQLQNRVAISDQNAVLGARIDASVAEILRRTGHDCPTAAYLVNAPTPVNFPVNACGQVQFGNGCGCGCGNGFAA